MRNNWPRAHRTSITCFAATTITILLAMTWPNAVAQSDDRVINATPGGKIAFQHGMTNVGGNGFNQLNGPYDAKQIGDYAGPTPPFDFDHDPDDR